MTFLKEPEEEILTEAWHLCSDASKDKNDSTHRCLCQTRLYSFRSTKSGHTQQLHRYETNVLNSSLIAKHL